MPSMEILTICAGMLVLVLVLCSQETSFLSDPPDEGRRIAANIGKLPDNDCQNASLKSL